MGDVPLHGVAFYVLRGGQEGRAAGQRSLQGYLAHKKMHPPLGPPKGPGYLVHKKLHPPRTLHYAYA